MSNQLDRGSLTDALIEMSSDALLALSPEGEVLSWNERAGAVFGYSPREAIGKRLAALLDGSGGSLESALDQAKRAGSASFHWSSLDRALRGVNVTLRRIDARDQPPFIAVRGTAEPPPVISLETEEGNDLRMRGLLEAAPDAMLLVDAGGRVVLANRQTEKLFGWSREELIGQPIEALVPARFRPNHPSHRGGYFHEPRTRPMGAGIDLYALRKDGSEFPAEISLAPVQARDGTFVTAAVRDISERRKVEA
jgi:PAS domain S-box-containing protein